MPAPDGELLPPPKRPWGTGSIELRSRGYLARWRDEHGRQRAQLFASAEEANTHLDQVYPKGSRLLHRSDVVGLIERWRARADSEWVRAESGSEIMRACSNDLARLLGYD